MSAPRTLAVVGGQWGDEGKGKVVDRLADRFRVVARYQGGPNAGHTVVADGVRHALHHVPSGVFRPGTRAVIGNGTVLDLPKLLEEIEGLASAGIHLEERLFISDRAHVILPIMARVDALAEASGDGRIGTTQKGIGPTYEAKAARLGVRIADLRHPDVLASRITRLLAGSIGMRLREAGDDLPDVQALARELLAPAERLTPYLADTGLLLNDWIDEGAPVLFEGAQGTLLDLDHGTYPYVTSSTTTAGGLCGGLGVSPRRVGGVLGVFKAYGTRVGAGPMPTELDDGPTGLGEALRQRGREYGTTTGRPRRCGWFDGVAAAYANRLNRFDAVAITLLDVLDALDEIRVCTGYATGGQALRSLPASVAPSAHVDAVLEVMPGWRQDTTRARRWDDLPSAARRYVDRLEELIGAEVAMVSVGPDREQTLVRPGTWLARTWVSP